MMASAFCSLELRLKYLPQEPDLSAFEILEDYVLDGLAENDDPYAAVRLLQDLGLTGAEK